MPSGWVGHVNDPSGVMTSSTSPGATTSLRKVDIRPSGTRADGDPAQVLHAGRAARLADRVGLAHLLAVDARPDGEVLTRLEAVLLEELVGHLEGDGDGVVGEPLDRGDGERVEAGPVARRSARGRSSGIVGS